MGVSYLAWDSDVTPQNLSTGKTRKSSNQSPKLPHGEVFMTLFGSGYKQAEMSNKRQSGRQTEEVRDDSGVG